jgi:hypothetical protein
VLPRGDILIHAGDILKFTRNWHRAEGEFYDFLDWFSRQPHEHKIFIAGNHDLLLDKEFCPPDIYKRVHAKIATYSKKGMQWHNGSYYEGAIHYLEREPLEIEVNREWGHPGRHLKIYGMPDTGFSGMAFGKIDPTVWSKIPEDTDILITHVPPKNIMDEILVRRLGEETKEHVGNADLLHWLKTSPSIPSLHVFGHIHRGHGVRKIKKTLLSKDVDGKEVKSEKITLYVNAAIEQDPKVGMDQELLHEPIAVHLL